MLQKQSWGTPGRLQGKATVLVLAMNTIPSSRALHYSAPTITSSTRMRQQAPEFPVPGCGHGSKRPQNPTFSLCTPALTPRGYGKESSLRERGRSTTRGDHLFRKKCSIAYDLLSGNIKQFKKPTLNHSDSSTLPTTLCLPSPQLPPTRLPSLPSLPPHSPGSERSLLPCPGASSARVCAHRDTAGTERGPRMETGGDELRFHP